jgi:hypothetical protein
MIGPGYTRSGQKIIIDPVAFTKKLSNPSDPNILMNDALKNFIPHRSFCSIKDRIEKSNSFK